MKSSARATGMTASKGYSSRPTLVAILLGVVLCVVVVLFHDQLLGQAANPEKTANAPKATADKLPRAEMLLPFQGRLLKASGEPVPEGDAVTVHFAIYPTDIGDTALWASNVSVKVEKGGYVSTILGGPKDPLDKVDFGAKLYLGIKVDDQKTAIEQQPEMLPHLPIVPTVYSQNSGRLSNHTWEEIEFRLRRLERKTVGFDDPQPQDKPDSMAEDYLETYRRQAKKQN